MADEALDINDPSKSAENKLRAATEVFQRKCRSVSSWSSTRRGQVVGAAARSNKALFCLSEDNPVRRFCKKIVETKYPLWCLNIWGIYTE